VREVSISMEHAEQTTAFYTVASANHFLGLVGLVNSLRLVGHREPVFVSDCGLTDAQRERLAPHVTLLEADHRGRSPHLVKTIVPLAHPADVMILVDADIIVTRRLDDLTETAREGKIVVFEDAIRRFDERWSELLALGPLRRQPYVNSGLIVMSREVGLGVLGQLAEGCRRVDTGLGYQSDGGSDYPFYYLDQDVLNAILASLPAERLDLRDHDLAPFPPFRGLHRDDAASLHCTYADGRAPFVLHHVEDKPWLKATRSNLYSKLLGRLLLGPDVSVRLDEGDVPLRFRSGEAAWLERRRLDATAAIGSLRGALGIRRVLARRARSDRMATDPGG